MNKRLAERAIMKYFLPLFMMLFFCTCYAQNIWEQFKEKNFVTQCREINSLFHYLSSLSPNIPYEPIQYICQIFRELENHSELQEKREEIITFLSNIEWIENANMDYVFLHALQDQKNERIRTIAAIGLAKFAKKSQWALPVLIRSLGDGSGYVVVACVEAIEKIILENSIRGIENIENALWQMRLHSNHLVRLACMKSLYQISSQYRQESLEEFKSNLSLALTNEDISFQIEALKIFRTLSPFQPDCLKTILDNYKSYSDMVKMEVLILLSQTNNEFPSSQDISILMEALNLDNIALRKQAAYALGERREKAHKALDLLIKKIDLSDEDLTMAYLLAINKIASISDRQVICPVLKNIIADKQTTKSWLFCKGDFKEKGTLFLDKIKNSNDPLTLFIYQSLNITQNQEILEESLIEKMNQMISSGNIFNKKLFININLSNKTKKLLTQHPREDNLIKLNRLLLEDAFPQEILKFQISDHLRLKSLQILGRLSPTDAPLKEFYSLLQSPTPLVALEAARYILEKNADYQEEAFRTFQNSPLKEEVIFNIQWVLKHGGGQRVKQALLEMLKPIEKRK